MVLVYHNKLTLQQNLVLTFFLLYHLVKLDMFRKKLGHLGFVLFWLAIK